MKDVDDLDPMGARDINRVAPPRPSTSPPHSIDAEQAVLGAALYQNTLFDRLADVLDADAFYEPTHGRLWTAMETALSHGRVADPITLKGFAESDAGMQELGGKLYLSELMAGAASYQAALDYARFVAECAQKRRVIDLCASARDRAFDGNAPASEAMEVLEAGLTVTVTGARPTIRPFAEAIAETIERSLAAQDRGYAPGAMLSGLATLDRMTGGVQRGHSALIAARHSIGKSALALAWSYGASIGDERTGREPMRGLYWTPEMRDYEHASRLMSSLSAKNYQDIDEGRLESYEMERVGEAAVSLRDLPIRFEEASSLSLAGLRALIRREKRRHDRLPLGYVVVDPVGYLKAEGRDEVEKNNRKAEAIKEMAGEFDLPILATHHLRKWAGHGDPRPSDQDIRDSGRWNDFMHLVLLAHRDSYYAEIEEAPKDPLKREAWQDRCNAKIMTIIQTKKRGGRRGAIDLGCNIAINKFWDLETRLTGVSV